MKKWLHIIDERLFGEDRLVRTLRTGWYMSLVAVIIALISVFVGVSAHKPAPDLNAEMTRFVRAQFVANNFLELWLTSTERDAAALKSMLADTAMVPTSFSTDPPEIRDINTADFAYNATDDGTSQWVFTLGVTVTMPGSGTYNRSFYAVTLMDRPDTSIRALTLPRPVDHSRPPVQLDSGYPHNINTRSALGTTLSNFGSAYYTKESGSLGRYVSSTFSAQPLTNSPYTGIELIGARSRTPIGGDTEADTAVDLMVTYKASITLSTFQYINVPITAKTVDTDQWVIEDLPNLSYFSNARTGKTPN